MTDSSTTLTPVESGSTTLAAATGKRNKLVIGLLLVSAFIMILNETIMGVALPQLMKDLDITASTAQWLTTAFMLTMAVVIPITGFLLERFNTRPVYIVAMSLFTTGTLLSAIAPGFEALLFGRIIQAGGTAIMMPLLMTTVMTLVAPSSRGKTMGAISIVISVAPAVGPTIGGLILTLLDWRWMFGVVLPIAAIALIVGVLRIKNVTTPRKVPVDVFSVILSAFAFGGLIYGLSSLGEQAEGTAPVPSWIPLAVGAVALGLFILRQIFLQRSNRALLDLRVFTFPVFTVSSVMLTVSVVAMFGTIIVIPMYVQDVLGLDPLVTGLLLLPGGLLMGVLAPFVGAHYDKHGPRSLVVAGSIAAAISLWAMTGLTETSSIWYLLAADVLLCVGLALLFTPLYTSGLGSLPAKFYSHGSAVFGTLQQVGGAAGTAMFVTVLTVQSAALATGGSNATASMAGGVHWAFVAGAVVATLAIVGAFFVRKPADAPAGALPLH